MTRFYLMAFVAALHVAFPCWVGAQQPDTDQTQPDMAFELGNHELDDFELDDAAAFESEVVSTKLPVTAARIGFSDRFLTVGNG